MRFGNKLKTLKKGQQVKDKAAFTICRLRISGGASAFQAEIERVRYPQPAQIAWWTGKVPARSHKPDDEGSSPSYASNIAHRSNG